MELAWMHTEYILTLLLAFALAWLLNSIAGKRAEQPRRISWSRPPQAE